MGITGITGFVGLESSSKKSKAKTAATRYSKEMLHKAECSACPLNSQVGLKHPSMKPTGSDTPVVYILGEAPGADEDKTGKHFIGKSGTVLRDRIPAKWKDKLRWNNVVRTRPPENKTPTYIEIECCRPSIIRDIEKTKPKAIFGFGNVPLNWATGLSGISMWCGRYMPVKIGDHVCWYFPMYHPSFIVRGGGGRGGDRDYASEEEFAFELHLKRAFSLVDKMPKAKAHSRDEAVARVRLIDGSNGDDDVEKIIYHLEKFGQEKVVGLDYETNGLRPFAEGSKILTVALSSKSGTIAFPLRHKQATWTPRQLKKLEAAFVAFLEGSKCIKVVHNLPFELEWSVSKFGKDTLKNGRWGCSQSQAYILDERAGSGVQSLDGLCLQYFGISIKAINPIDRANLDNAPLGDVLLYNGVDAKYHRLLYLAQAERIVSEDLREQYYHNLERVAALVQMQVKGVPVSAKKAAELDSKYTEQIKVIDKKLEAFDSVQKYKKVFQAPFRPGSNDDVKKLMTKVLKHHIDSADEAAIKDLGEEATLILKRRKIAKLHSTYVSAALPGSSVLFGNRFHPIIATTTTRTWRTSSDSPNSQNWPKYEGKEVREIIEPGGDLVVVAFDFGGIQARNVAQESKDKALVKAFHERYDIHSDWMERIARRHPQWIKEGVKKLAKDKDIRKHYRQQSKNKLVFPLFFGAGAKTTSSGLGVPEDIGYALGEEFREAFPGIAKWQQNTRNFYRENGYVTGLSGFRRRAPVAPTEIINTPIQSDESVIVLDALIRLTDLDEDRFIPSFEIHDDLTFIWPKKEVDRNAETVISVMLSSSFEWVHIVPMSVEMSVGTNWANIKNVGEYFSDEWNGSIGR